MDMEFLTLENNKDYMILSKIEMNNNLYYLLMNPNTKYDYIIRKESGEEIVGLDNEEELQKVILKLAEDNNDNKEIINYLTDIINKSNK